MNEGAGRRVTYARREGVVGRPEVKERRNLWLALTEPAAPITDDVERRRARQLSALLVSLFVLVLLATVTAIPVLAGPDFVAERDANFVAGISVSVVLLVAYGLSRSRAYVVGVWMGMSALYVGIMGAVLAGSSYISTNVLVAYLVVVVLLGSMFLSAVETAMLALLSLVSVVALPLANAQLTIVGLVPAMSIIVIPSALLVVSAAVRERDLLQIERRNRQLRATAEVSQAMTAAQEFVTLLDGAVEFISQVFDFYHVQVFLIDEAQNAAVLRSSTGDVGRRLLERGHQLPVGSVSVIGQVTAHNAPIVASDVSSDPVHQRNEFLPETRSELALPLRAGEKILGALDIQSTEPNAFSADDIDTLQIMANQIAVTLENARLLDEVQSRALENERLLEEAQASLSQIEALNRRLTGEGWQEYLRTHGRDAALGYTLQEGRSTEDTDWTAGMRRAISQQRLVVGGQSSKHESKTVSVPLSVRGALIGVVEVERDSKRQWSDDDLVMVQSLVDRLSVALDNARLVEQSEALAQREQLVNELAHTMQGADSVDDILQTALVELGQALGASRGVVQLKSVISDEQLSAEPTHVSGPVVTGKLEPKDDS